jgi:pentatricopeptide repeat protein
MISGKQDMQDALDIYSTMQRNHCEPDAIVYGNLISLAGKVGDLGARPLLNLCWACARSAVHVSCIVAAGLSWQRET